MALYIANLEFTEIILHYLIFDTKYKRMSFNEIKGNGVDIDRKDFFQINTYMSYYQNNGFNVKVGGLLYPMEKKFQKDICHSQNWFGNQNTKFIIDGLELSSLEELKDDENKFAPIIEVEDRFIQRINNHF